MLTITIDGPAGAGKSTTADIVAKKLGIRHLNTGAMYRAVAVKMLDNGISPTDAVAIGRFIDDMDMDVEFIDDKQHVFVNGEDVTGRLYENEISTKSSLYSVHFSVRQALSNISRQLAKKMSFVLDGRDSGSYVLPNAEFKFYLDCDSMERARRRQKELKEKGNDISLEQLHDEIVKRDEFDKNKKIAPLVVPKNAIIIDSTNLTLNETVHKIVKTIEGKRY